MNVLILEITLGFCFFIGLTFLVEQLKEWALRGKIDTTHHDNKPYSHYYISNNK